MKVNINELFQDSTSLTHVVAKVIGLVTRLLDAEKAGVMLFNEEKNELVLQKPAFGIQDDELNCQFRYFKSWGECIDLFCPVLIITTGIFFNITGIDYKV